MLGFRCRWHSSACPLATKEESRLPRALSCGRNSPMTGSTLFPTNCSGHPYFDLDCLAHTENQVARVFHAPLDVRD